MLYIGIDPGVNTGLAVWSPDQRKLLRLQTTTILAAMQQVDEYCRHNECTIIVEDARQRKWFGRAGVERLQGAGSIKRDCMIWEEFLISRGYPYQMVAPMNNRTKLPHKMFRALTGHSGGRTTQHARDAAMLVIGYKEAIKQGERDV
jgi:hypothetical protein